jgi:hypothetical protein
MEKLSKAITSLREIIASIKLDSFMNRSVVITCNGITVYEGSKEIFLQKGEKIFIDRIRKYFGGIEIEAHQNGRYFEIILIEDDDLDTVFKKL